eukprot:TRINITY_DN3821_c0_g1_i5.p1 TRINITY_DN3821_c0_g1~~TRINITY_DN3821_c0_g1_i5.p1  ORF type:complete len:210 (+),score=33.54 TRINITY_DN3821_c0_g1_i5:186-815(+)
MCIRDRVSTQSTGLPVAPMNSPQFANTYPYRDLVEAHMSRPFTTTMPIVDGRFLVVAPPNQDAKSTVEPPSNTRTEHNPKYAGRPDTAVSYPYYSRVWDNWEAEHQQQQHPILAPTAPAQEEEVPVPRKYDSLAYSCAGAGAARRPYWQSYKSHVWGSAMHNPRDPSNNRRHERYVPSDERLNREDFQTCGIGPGWYDRMYGTWWHSAR